MLLSLLTINLEKISASASSLFQTMVVIGYTISYLYITYILIKAIYRKTKYLEHILIILTSFVLYWVLVAMKILFEIDLGYIQSILIMYIFIGAASLINSRMQKSYDEMESLTGRLIAYNKSKDAFLARVSHELRTPLHVILNLTKSLIEGKKGSLSFKQQENLILIERQSTRLTRLVESLLDASQINNVDISLNIQAVNGYNIVKDILQEMELLVAKDKELVLINKIPPVFPLLKADPDKFIQIFYNLIHNAIKFTDKGEVVVSAYLDDGQAIFVIKDSGIGIREKDIGEIFDAFYSKKEDQNTEDGLGLGLPIVKHLVELQGGWIDVGSVYGQGSSFRFSIPLYEKDAGDLQYAESSISRHNMRSSGTNIKSEKKVYKPGNKYTILMVDDEPHNQKVMLDAAIDMDYNIILAASGDEALKALEENKIDLILLDFMLPDMPGDQVCRMIRKQYSIIDIPILVLTASGRNIDLLSSFEYGINDFLKKPVDMDELKSRIRSLMLMKSSAEENLNKEFQYFYSQISPHFLYNAINAIIGLSYEDSEGTRKALNNLAVYFRGKLDLYKGKNLIPLEKELELVAAYLEIEQMRFGNALKIEYNIDKNIEVMIPPLTLQPLVENSIRHGIGGKKDGGKITITAKMSGRLVHLIVEDNGIGMTLEKQQELLKVNSESLGFRNVMEKIKLIKGSSLEFESKVSEGTRIDIIIPKGGYNESNTS